MLVTRKSDTGPCSGNSIFLPAAGSRSGGSLDNAGSLGDYWSSSLFEEEDLDLAREVYINSVGVNRGRCGRYYGQSIRPLTE